MGFVRKISPLLLMMTATNCGGVSKKAKIATAIEVMLANAVTSYASKGDTTALSVTFNCNGVDDSGGTLSYSVPSDLTDPQKLIDFISTNADGVTLDVVYAQCEVKACGDKLILDGPAKLKLNVNVEDYIAGDNAQTPASFTLSATELQAAGLLSQTLSFGYTINAKYTSDSLESITIESSSPANPLKVDDDTYNAEDVLSLADGC